MEWYIYDWVHVGHKAQVSYKKSDLLSHTAFSFLACTFNLSQDPMISYEKKEDLGLVYGWLWVAYKHHPKVREIIPMGRTWSSALGCSRCLEGEMARHVILNQFMGSGLWFYWMVKIWKEHDWKIDNKEIWEKFIE